MLFASADALAIWVTGFLGAVIAAAVGWVSVRISLAMAKRADDKQDALRDIATAERRGVIDTKLQELEVGVLEAKKASGSVAVLATQLEGLRDEVHDLKQTLKELLEKINTLLQNPPHVCIQMERLMRLEVRQDANIGRVERVEGTIRKCAACSEAGREG